MTLFLRDEKNNSVVDMDCWIETSEDDSDYKYIELSVTVDIQSYSMLLLRQPLKKQVQVITDFSDIQELRGWLWERYFMGGKNDPDKYDDVLAKLKAMLREVGERYDLALVQD